MTHISRRRFVQGFAGVAGGTLLGGDAERAWSAAAPGSAARTTTASAAAAGAGVLSGTCFDLSIGALAVNYTGAWRHATAVNAQVPGPLLRWREGDTVTLRVTNHLPVASSIHWHGVLVPADMDGVPGLSFAGIAPGQSYRYRFRVRQSGTYWYHSHSGFQEQTGLHGPIVIEPRAGERHPTDRDYVVMLADWTDADPEHIYRTLKRDSDYYNYHRRTLGDFFSTARARGLGAAVRDRSMWSRMRMDPTDLSDVSGYTYLMNGHTPAANWTGVFDAGQSVRLRFINGSAMSFFDVRIPGLALTVVAADGQDVEPVTVDELRIGTAEVYDLIVRPRADRAYTIFAQSMDRTGYARGTLAPRRGMQAEIPALDPRPILTLADLGMGAAMTMRGMSTGGKMPAMPAPARTAAAMASMRGPGVDMRIASPWSGLDDPGIGLRHNGRRELTYADLHTIGGALDARGPDREIELHLTGNMRRYMWSFNGQKFSQAQPLRFKQGERLRLVLINDTMMAHPIHLHGMWSEVQAPDGQFQVRKHTVRVQPAQRISYLVSANPPGHWAYHCHLLYHMMAGMFREVIVAS